MTTPSGWTMQAVPMPPATFTGRQLDWIGQRVGATPRAIAEGNGVRWNTPDVNAWIKRSNGREVTPGNWVFTSSSRIFLPPFGTAQPALPPPGIVSTGETASEGYEWPLGAILGFMVTRSVVGAVVGAAAAGLLLRNRSPAPPPPLLTTSPVVVTNPSVTTPVTRAQQPVFTTPVLGASPSLPPPKSNNDAVGYKPAPQQQSGIGLGIDFFGIRL